MNNSDTRPIIGIDHQRGRRYEWAVFDALMRGASTRFQRREVSKDGRHERIIRIGSLADGRNYRSREFYAI